MSMWTQCPVPTCRAMNELSATHCHLCNATMPRLAVEDPNAPLTVRSKLCHHCKSEIPANAQTCMHCDRGQQRLTDPPPGRPEPYRLYEANYVSHPESLLAVGKHPPVEFMPFEMRDPQGAQGLGHLVRDVVDWCEAGIEAAEHEANWGVV